MLLPMVFVASPLDVPRSLPSHGGFTHPTYVPPMKRILGVTLGSVLLLVLGLAGNSSATANTGVLGGLLPGIDHIVVIYQENHSFDNLYGGSDLRKSVNRTHSDVRFLFGMARRNLLKLR
jgi:hypothetical protein